MTQALWITGLIVLAGCSDPARNAEEQLDFVRNYGSPAEKCTAASKVYDVYMSQRDEKNLNSSRLRRDIYCQSADLDPRNAP